MKPRRGFAAVLVLLTAVLVPATAHGATVDRQINFQPAAAPLAPGFTADIGGPYSDTAGQGWVREDSLGSATHVPLDVTLNTRDRNIVNSQALDTFIHMQYPTSGPG